VFLQEHFSASQKQKDKRQKFEICSLRNMTIRVLPVWAPSAVMKAWGFGRTGHIPSGQVLP